jgi:hypothetical protein
LRRLVVTLILSLTALTACTPAQLAHLGLDPGAPEHQPFLDLPDAPLHLADRVVWPDGNVSVAPAGSRCPQWYGYAKAAGWQDAEWATLDRVMWRESRCQPGAHNPHGRDNSFGLTQLNMRAHAGWVGPIVDWDFNRLFDPATNLRVARVLFERVHGSWSPWRATAH